MRKHGLPRLVLWAAVLALAGGTAPPARGIDARGGLETRYVQNGTNWTAHVFTNSGTLTFLSAGQVEYLVVAGGGGGGAVWQGGGGGGGGFLTGSADVTTGSLDVVVGAGGKGVSQPGGPSNGGDSLISNAVFGVIRAYGGGYGGGESVVAASGGSGGGGSHGSCTRGWTVADGRQGHDGGEGASCDAGGGGGAGGPGKSAVEGRAGGPGRPSSMRDGKTPAIYAAGGTGHGRDGVDGVSKSANTGHGGDGSGVAAGDGKGGNGGSGIVIVRYVSLSARNETASSVTRESAVLEGVLDAGGGSAVSACVMWGEKSGGNTWDWAKTEWFEKTDWSDETPLKREIGGLAGDKTYYYTFGAKGAQDQSIADPALSFITGEVNLESVAESAREKGPDGVPVPVALTFSRPASCVEAPLPVAYALSGTASNGADYAALSGTVVLPAGAAEARLAVAPWNDMTVEGDETVVITLLPGPYIVGPGRTATVTIADTVVRTFYVSPDASPTPPYDTWATGFKNLQDALDNPAAKSDAVICLAGGRTFGGPGIAERDGDRTVFRWRNAANVQLLGGYRADAKLAAAAHPGPRDAGPAILKRTAGSGRVLTLSGIAGAVIEQAIVRDGLLEGRRGLGAGVCVVACSNVAFRGCAIVCNTNAAGYLGMGGGLYVEGSDVTVSDTAIATNRVHGRYSYGGGLYVHHDGRVTVAGSAIRANEAHTSGDHAPRGGGCYVFPGGVLELDKTAVEGNRP
ncbi:MAG: hypothetical protein FJ225_10850 [Lentisphaerae bacterium]|nr:hypothetical protein [Lentisphaerota bacterium]